MRRGIAAWNRGVHSVYVESYQAHQRHAADESDRKPRLRTHCETEDVKISCQLVYKVIWGPFWSSTDWFICIFRPFSYKHSVSTSRPQYSCKTVLVKTRAPKVATIKPNKKKLHHVFLVAVSGNAGVITDGMMKVIKTWTREIGQTKANNILLKTQTDTVTFPRLTDHNIRGFNVLVLSGETPLL